MNWINASERQPSVPAWYLVTVATRWKGHMVVMAYYHGKGKWAFDDLESVGEPLYWQPLPELPEGL
jgi:hypothetical protein